jgi:nucleotide-binding universal stress UspA family protein
MYERVLVATDGSAIANRALDEAIRLAKANEAELRVVHAIDALYMGVEPDLVTLPEVREAQAKAGREILAAAEAAAKAAGARVDTRLVRIERVDQRIVDAIAEEAASWPADVLVVGTHGRRGLHRVLLGSVAEGLARVAAMPVLLVREGSDSA